jgi:SAM-dependent methyltransferase
VSLRGRLGGLAQRGVVKAAGRFGYETYRPARDYRAQLDRVTTLREDGRPIRDHRPSTLHDGYDLTLTEEGLADVLAGTPRGLRVLEVGPKYGVHARWLDRTLAPAELVFSDFPSDRPLHEQWAGELATPHRFVYGDLRTADELLELEPFDLVVFLGVLYHSVHHLPLLSRLNRVTRAGGTLLLETTIDPRPDASVRLRWPADSGKAKAVPTFEAVRLLLAWSGFRTVTHFLDYRPGSSEILLLCEKTDELADDGELAPVVSPHRQPAPAD